MREYLKRILASPIDDHPDFRPFIRRILITLNIAIFALILAEIFFVQRRGAVYTVISLSAVLFVTQMAYWTFRNGKLLPTKLVLPFASYAILTYVLILGNGMHDSALMGYAVVITLSSLLLGPRSTPYVGLISMSSLAIVTIADMKGLAGPPEMAQRTGIDDFIVGSVLIWLTILILRQVQNRLYQVLDNLNRTLEEQQHTTHELESIKGSLEELVAERTAALQNALQNMEALREEEQRLAKMYQSIAILARRIAQSSAQATTSSSDLLEEIALLISDTFGYYHVGIFLLDRSQQHAILSAANSEGGKAMLAEHHLLPVGLDSIVGTAIVRGEPYIVSNTEGNSAHFKNPHLPRTQAEAAFPMFAGGEMIGVLDVQSDHAEAFGENEIEILEILADEVAVAIYNARLLENTQRQLAEMQTIYREQARQSWKSIARRLRIAGYRYRPGLLQPLENPIRSLASAPPKAVQLIPNPQKGEVRILAPIQLRGETLAVLEVRTQKDIAEEAAAQETIQAITDRIALALENARLYEETTRRAQREHMVAQIANALRSTDNPDEMLQTAIRELKQALGAREVRIISHD